MKKAEAFDVPFDNGVGRTRRAKQTIHVELPSSWTSVRVFQALCEEASSEAALWLGAQGVSFKEPPRGKKIGKKARAAEGTSSGPLHFAVPPMINYNPGLAPIVMSAPHAGKCTVPGCPTRTGRYAEGIYSAPIVGTDGGTWVMCELACGRATEIIGMPVPYIRSGFARKHADLNRGPIDDAGRPYCQERGSGYETPEQEVQWRGYHNMLRKTLDMMVSHYGFCILIDLHSNRRPSEGHAGIPIAECLTRGTKHGQSTKELEERCGLESITGPHSLFGELHGMGYNVEPPLDMHPSEECVYMGGFITEHYGKIPNVYAMQIEVGSGYRGEAERVSQTGTDIGEAMGRFFKHFFQS